MNLNRLAGGVLNRGTARAFQPGMHIFAAPSHCTLKHISVPDTGSSIRSVAWIGLTASGGHRILKRCTGVNSVWLPVKYDEVHPWLTEVSE